MLMFCISITELTAHGLVEVCRIIRIVRLCILKLCKCLAKILELCLEGKIHFLEERIQDFSDCIFLAFGNRIDQYIQRIVHLLESRGDYFFKALCHLYRKFLCHLSMAAVWFFWLDTRTFMDSLSAVGIRMYGNESRKLWRLDVEKRIF